MNIPLSFGDYEGRSGSANASSMVNMMVETDSEGGAAPYHIVGTPGCKEFAYVGIAGEGRGGFRGNGYILAVVGMFMYSIDTDTGNSSLVGQLETTTGCVQWAENPEQIMVVDCTNGYVYTKATKVLKKITDADFPVPTSCAFKDGYGVVVEADTGKFFVSGINDFFSWGALAFTTAEYEPDNLVSCLASHDSLYAFGVDTTQTYYNSGNSSFPFDNRQGANMQIGCGATGSPAKGENIIFWLDSHGIVRKIDGYAQQIISTRQIEYKISQLDAFSDARGFVYTQEGHTFYVLIFPDSDLTLVYDLSTGMWHDRKSYASMSRWRPAWVVQEGKKVFAGDYSNGKVYQLDSETYTENAEALRWEFTLQNINTDRHMIIHNMLELHIESGVGIATGQGSDPMLWMTYSDDDGKTWSREKWRSMGKIGEFKKRIKFFGLGRSRSRVYKIGGSDPVKRVIISARLDGQTLGY